jgi:5-methylcytosine-specific restriction endonuclease McrA
MKKCSTCGIEKEESEFHHDKHTSDGLTYQCKQCRKKAACAWKMRNVEHIKEVTKKYRNSHKEELKQKCKKYYQDNHEKEKERKLKDYRQNKNLWNDRRRKYDSSSHGKNNNRKWSSFGRAKKLSSLTEIVDPEKVFSRDKGICHICGCPVQEENWEMDHVIPLSVGGNHTYENVAVSHRSCNRKKGNKINVKSRMEAV